MIYDFNIESQLYINCEPINKVVLEQKIEKDCINYIDYFNSIKDFKYVDKQYDFLYPIHKTIQDELKKEGLGIISFNKDEDIDGLTSYEFEVNDNGLNIAEIEYKIIQKLDLTSKNITITVY